MFRQTGLPQNHFDSVVRLIKRAPLDRVNMLRHATHNTLKRLGVDRDLSKAVKGLPNGSNQGDVMSIVVWLDKVKPGDVEVVKQVVAIDATAVNRSKG